MLPANRVSEKDLTHGANRCSLAEVALDEAERLARGDGNDHGFGTDQPLYGRQSRLHHLRLDGKEDHARFDPRRS